MYLKKIVHQFGHWLRLSSNRIISDRTKTDSEIYSRFLQSCPEYTNSYNPIYNIYIIQGNQKVSVHLMITESYK